MTTALQAATAPQTEKQEFVVVKKRNNETLEDALLRHGFTLSYTPPQETEWPIVNEYTPMKIYDVNANIQKLFDTSTLAHLRWPRTTY
jgi:hypothetical protein